MTLELTSPPPMERAAAATPGALRRFSVAEYHEMLAKGVLPEDERVELLEGLIVAKMPHDPIHDAIVQVVDVALRKALPSEWFVRVQSAMTIAASEPEPDLVVHRGDPRSFLHRHPGVADVVLIVEVANSSLQRDREWKAAINARAGIEYWIVNLVDGVVERYSMPIVLPGGVTSYRDRVQLRGDDVIVPPVPGASAIRVGDLLP